MISTDIIKLKSLGFPDVIQEIEENKQLMIQINGNMASSEPQTTVNIYRNLKKTSEIHNHHVGPYQLNYIE